jgi:hypothetical protein
MRFLPARRHHHHAQGDARGGCDGEGEKKGERGQRQHLKRGAEENDPGPTKHTSEVVQREAKPDTEHHHGENDRKARAGARVKVQSDVIEPRGHEGPDLTRRPDSDPGPEPEPEPEPVPVRLHPRTVLGRGGGWHHLPVYDGLVIDWSLCSEVERDVERVSGAWVFRGTPDTCGGALRES